MTGAAGSAGRQTRHRYDVVVVGGGAAGLRAALAAGSVAGPDGGPARVAVLGKVHPVRSGTGAVRGGIAAALGNAGPDSWPAHAADTARAGAGISDADAVTMLCREAVGAVLEAEHLGLPFDRTAAGSVAQRRAPGHTGPDGEPVARSAHAADRTGHLLLHTLYQQCLARGIRFHDEFWVLDVLLDTAGAGPARGVVAVELATGRVHVLAAAAVVLATGGFGTAFATTSDPYGATGDGPAMLLRHGLPLQDVEFVQFSPTGLAGYGFALTGAARGEGGVLRNAAGEAFGSPDTRTDTDAVRAVLAEVRAGRGVGEDGGNVLLDLTGVPADRLARALPDVAGLARTFLDLDPAADPVPVRPTAHGTLGGIPTTVDGEVLSAGGAPVPGLYAAGECACVSVHGANRLGGNGLAEAVVFGRRAGLAAGRHAASTGPAEPPEAADMSAEPAAGRAEAMLAGLRDGPSDGSAGAERAAPLRAALRASMDAGAGPSRTAAGLARAQAELAGLRERYARVVVSDRARAFNTELLEAVELGFLLDVAEVLVAAARARTESRGVHLRDDHPDPDDRFARHTLVYREAGALRLDHRPVRAAGGEPAGEDGP